MWSCEVGCWIFVRAVLKTIKTVYFNYSWNLIIPTWGLIGSSYCISFGSLLLSSCQTFGFASAFSSTPTLTFMWLKLPPLLNLQRPQWLPRPQRHFRWSHRQLPSSWTTLEPLWECQLPLELLFLLVWLFCYWLDGHYLIS